MSSQARRRTEGAPRASSDSRRQWTFITKHAAVLLHVARHPDDTMRSIAADLGLTERTTAAVIADLREGGYIRVQRQGRRNRYRVMVGKRLRRQGYTAVRVGDLLEPVSAMRGAGRRTPGARLP